MGIAAKLQGGVVPLSSRHPQGFHLQVFLLHQIRVLMTAMLDTTHVSPAWRSTGLPTSWLGAAGRKPRDAGATHHCTCRSDKTLNMLRDLPIFPCSETWVAAFSYTQLTGVQHL